MATGEGGAAGQTQGQGQPASLPFLLINGLGWQEGGPGTAQGVQGPMGPVSALLPSPAATGPLPASPPAASYYAANSSAPVAAPIISVSMWSPALLAASLGAMVVATAVGG